MNVVKTMRTTHWTTRNSYVAPPRRTDLIEEELDGELMLFDPRSDNTYRLNETALSVWRWCDGRATTRRIARRQTRSYDVDFETALDHVEQLVMLFVESGLLDSGCDS
jgi:hypothetical protein